MRPTAASLSRKTRLIWGCPATQAGDSILCFHPDGHVTIFATNLHAVFGLAYVDGKLFVHHTPDFSVFIDDNGVGKDRKDLFTTNPNPNLNGSGFNDHIPSNIHLGMDGWFYMTTGDKGIYGAVGKDGSKVNFTAAESCVSPGRNTLGDLLERNAQSSRRCDQL